MYRNTTGKGQKHNAKEKYIHRKMVTQGLNYPAIKGKSAEEEEWEFFALRITKSRKINTKNQKKITN